MKPASLGFVVPGMRAEYGVSAATVAWLPFAALCGTVVGSVLWGWLADLYGRRASILLSAVMFVGTSICGAMPSLWWNVGMCFLMGAAAGGMLPVTYALLAETMPSKQRGWALVLVGGLGAAGGYLAASALSAWLVPILSWRILWFLNLPTGLALIFLNVFIPSRPSSCSRSAASAKRMPSCSASAARSRTRAASAGAGRRREVARRRADRLPRPDGRAQHRRARLGADQLRLAAVDAGAPGRQGLQHGRLERPARASALIAVPTVFVAPGSTAAGAARARSSARSRCAARACSA
jgi:MFS family permease